MGDAARIRPLVNLHRPGLALVWLLFAMSGVVMVEPAPFDVLLLALTALFFISGLKFPPAMVIPIVLLAVFFLSAMIGAMQSPGIATSWRHLAITIYLAVSTLFAGCLIARYQAAGLRMIFLGTCIAAMVAVSAGIVGYFSLAPGAYDLFTQNFRMMGTFKDPNVFGPFLIIPALYAVLRLVRGAGLRTPLWLGVFGLCLIGIFLSFSRGAWGHFAFSFALTLGLLFITSANGGERMRITATSLFLGVLGAVGLAGILSVDVVSSLLAERLQLFQSYDVSGGGGRFAGQAFALQLIQENPFGIGKAGFDAAWGAAPHNVYLYMFLQAGWLGGLAYLCFVLCTLAAGLHASFKPGPLQGMAIVAFASFAGLAALGMLIDTDHWRHFFLLTGMIWGAFAANAARARAATPGFARPAANPA